MTDEQTVLKAEFIRRTGTGTLYPGAGQPTFTEAVCDACEAAVREGQTIYLRLEETTEADQCGVTLHFDWQIEIGDGEKPQVYRMDWSEYTPQRQSGDGVDGCKGAASVEDFEASTGLDWPTFEATARIGAVLDEREAGGRADE